MKIFLFRKQTILVCVLSFMLVAAAICAGAVNNDLAVNNTFQGKELPIYRVSRSDNLMAISFDAAWGNEDTEEIIEILEKYKVKATFFVVGEWADKYPESVKALYEAGHEIMNHSDTHPHMTQLSEEDMLKEVENCSMKIQKITGERPILFRPPYGDYNNNVISTLFENGYYSVQWDVDSLDWKDLSAEEITERVVSKAKEGSIVLFHNAALHTPEALPAIIETLQGKGLRLVKISELIYKENYKINSQGEQYISTETNKTSV